MTVNIYPSIKLLCSQDEVQQLEKRVVPFPGNLALGKTSPWAITSSYTYLWIHSSNY